MEDLLAIWNSIGNEGWAKFTEAFITRPYRVGSGWTDLVIAQGNFLRFVEVKTSDKLSRFQEDVISELLLPLGLSVSVLR